MLVLCIGVMHMEAITAYVIMGEMHQCSLAIKKVVVNVYNL